MMDLPPLPDETLLGAEVCGHVAEFHGYTADQMRDYARSAVAAAMERLGAVLTKSYTGGTCLSNRDDTATICLHYANEVDAEAAYDAITNAIDDAIRAAKGE